ncbi:hypothetical protein HID58_074304, partial [Brassica napus]
ALFLALVTSESSFQLRWYHNRTPQDLPVVAVDKTHRKQNSSPDLRRRSVSDSDDDTTPSSMDSTAPTSPPVDVVDVGSSTKFPRRLFAPGFFPTQLRLNIYSKANVIASVASALKDLTTPEHNEPDVPPESGRSPNEDLKSWILEQQEEDDHGYSGSPKSVENQYKKQRPNRKSRKINSTVPKPGQEMHSYPLRSADGLEGTIGNTQPGFSRETRENNENSTLLTPQFDQNATDQVYVFKQRQFDQNATYQCTIYKEGVRFSYRSHSYVSPAKKDDTYIGEKAVDVKWDEANPHAYSSVKEVPARERPSSDPNPESAPDFASTRSEDNVGPVFTNLSGQKRKHPL